MWRGWQGGRLRVAAQHSLSSYQSIGGTAMRRYMLALTPILVLVCTSSSLIIPTPCGAARHSTTASTTLGEDTVPLSAFCQPFTAHP